MEHTEDFKRQAVGIVSCAASNIRNLQIQLDHTKLNRNVRYQVMLAVRREPDKITAKYANVIIAVGSQP